MGDVIHTVDEGNLLLVALHGDVLPIDDQRASEAFPVAVPGCDVIVVWKGCQFPTKLPVGSSGTFLLPVSERTNACALEMQGEQRLGRSTVIDAEISGAIVAVVAIQASSRSFFSRSQALAKMTGKMASGSVFLGVNMFKVGKEAS